MIGAMRLLLVDGEPKARACWRKGFGDGAYAVDVAADGQSALLQTAANECDLVLLDVMLPIRDGFDVWRAIRGAGCAVRIGNDWKIAYDIQNADQNPPTR